MILYASLTLTKRMKSKPNLIIIILGAPIRHAACHLFGEKHTLTHRSVIGVIAMATGVCIAKSGELFHFEIMQYACDLVGYGIHGIGVTPILEHLIELSKVEEEDL